MENENQNVNGLKNITNNSVSNTSVNKKISKFLQPDEDIATFSVGPKTNTPKSAEIATVNSIPQKQVQNISSVSQNVGNVRQPQSNPIAPAPSSAAKTVSQTVPTKPTQKPINMQQTQNNRQNADVIPQPRQTATQSQNTKPAEASKEPVQSTVDQINKTSDTVVPAATLVENKPQQNAQPSQSQQPNSSQLQLNTDIDPKFAKFVEQYERKKENANIKPMVGKYDSDLDFQLNRKIKKVRFPLTKVAKAIIAMVVILIVAAASFVLVWQLKDDTPDVVLKHISMTQPYATNVYIVNNVYVGDKLSCDNIYINCEYSDGTKTTEQLKRDMLTTASQAIDTNDIFIQSGDVVFTVSYKDRTLNLKYVVQEKVLDSLSLFYSKENIDYDFLVTTATLDLSNKLIINANFNNGSQKISLDDCTYTINGRPATNFDNGTIDLAGLTKNLTYKVDISYQSKTASIYVMINY